MIDEPENQKQPRDVDGSIRKVIVDRKSSPGKTRKEIAYYVRVRKNEYDADGNFVKQHSKHRTCDTFEDAKQAKRDLQKIIDDKIAESQKPKIRPVGKRFFDLLDFFKNEYVKPAVFVAGKKKSGQKEKLRHTYRMIDSFKEYFGNPFLVEIDYAWIRKYKEWMLETPYKVRLRIKLEENEVWDGEIFVRHKQRFKIVEEERERTPATVHRYLSKLRRIFSVGVQEGLLAINPFKQGDTLIETSIEVTRDRICSYEEEDAIYSVCTGQRTHLADVVTIAIDTFVRENELFSLLGSDINFDSRFLNVREMNSKTSQTRTVPLSDRALAAFKRLRGNRPTDEWNRSRVFDIKSVGSSWYTALKKTGIEDLRIHDLRGTGITRMLDASVPVPVVMKYSGHKKYETFMKYVKKDLRMIQNAADAINLLHRQRQNEIARANLALDNNAEKPASELETIEINVEQ